MFGISSPVPQNRCRDLFFRGLEGLPPPVAFGCPAQSSSPFEIEPLVQQAHEVTVADHDMIEDADPEELATFRQSLRAFLTLEATRWQYTHGVSDPEMIAPEAYTLDAVLLERPGAKEIQLDLFLDYSSNVALYPKFQEYFRDRKPPMLAIWGKHDPFFLPVGAESYRRDNSNVIVELLDTGHFALETHVDEIAGAVDRLLEGFAGS